MIYFKGCLLISLIFFYSCKNTNKPQTSPYDVLINNPMSADKPMDTINIPKIQFDESSFNFGIVQQGDSVIHEFHFTNSGHAPLLITNVSSSCGCTVPKLYKDRLEAGESSVLKVVFNTKNKLDFQEKKITIFANTFPSETVITIFGNVKN
jgi:hypothetical protein